MEDLHQCKGIFDEWITLLDAEVGKQINLKKSELQVNIKIKMFSFILSGTLFWIC